MNASCILSPRLGAYVRVASRGVRALLAPPAEPAAAPVAISGGVLFRRPSRRMVTELSSLFAVSPIVFGLAILVAAPLPRSAYTAAPRPSVYGALANMTPAPSVEAAPMRQAKATERLPTLAPMVAGPAVPPAPTGAAEQSEPSAIDTSAARVVVADDGHLIMDGERVRLSGIVMPEADATCRRLDGVEVRCLERVVARLSVVMQQGALTCRTTTDASGGRVGTCLAGKIDLAQDLVRARLARRVQTSARELGV